MLPPDLLLTPLSRQPVRLSEATLRTAMEIPIPPPARAGAAGEGGRVSVVIVTYNQVAFTRLCLAGLLADVGTREREILVVDNGSTDGTPEYLAEVERLRPDVRVIRNPSNLGFARANNVGLAVATGDVLVLLNNDTIVPPGGLERLVRHLADAEVGLVGPVTNRIGNEAEIETTYRTYSEMVELADARACALAGERLDVRTLCMYCLAMRRAVFEEVGPLDESFEVGMLEDDDYSLRAHRAGLRVVCAEDAFVHHFGGASFGELVPTGEYLRILHANRERFQRKWGVPWEPYGRRLSAGYLRLRREVSRAVRDATSAGASVLVVSRGDEDLLRIDGRATGHFPQVEDGAYSGSYPADSQEAVSHLEALRGRGAEFLVLPRTAFWWLDHYRELGSHLEGRYEVAVRDEDCLIFDLREAATSGPGRPRDPRHLRQERNGIHG